MKHLIIDGYNLIGIQHRDLEKARDDLIRQLYCYSEIKGFKITLVFDGWKDGKLTETRSKTGNLTVIYSKLGEKADQVIRRLISSANRSFIVVSSDREISDHARRKNCATVSSDAFEKKLASVQFQRGHDNLTNSFFYDSEDDIEPAKNTRKGDPKRPSRRDKKSKETLKSL